MKFEVRIYENGGKHKGTTVLDSNIDTIKEGKWTFCPVNTQERAERYAREKLCGKGQYAFVQKIGRRK